MSNTAPSSKLQRVAAWLLKGGFALADQLLVSGSNFVLAVLLARWLAEEDYGAYAVAFAVFLLLATLYQALVLVPSLVLGSTTYKGRHQDYFGALIRLHGLASLVGVVVLGITAAACFRLTVDDRLAWCFAGLAGVVPGVLLYWLARAAWYLTLRPAPAAAGAFLYCAMLAAGIGVLRGFGTLTGFSGLLVMAVAGGVTGTVLLRGLGPKVRGGSIPLKEVWKESWVYGRWELAVAAALWLPVNLCYPVTAGVLGTAQTATLRALQNFSLPVTHALTAVLRLAQPYVSAQFAERGIGAARLAFALAAAATGAGLVYLVVTFLLRKPLFVAAYGGKFLDATGMLAWVVLTSVFAAGTESLGVGLRAARSSRAIFYSYLAGGLVFVFGSVPAARAAGLPGVVAMLVLSGMVSLLVALSQFERLRRRDRAVPQNALDQCEVNA